MSQPYDSESGARRARQAERDVDQRRDADDRTTRADDSTTRADDSTTRGDDRATRFEERTGARAAVGTDRRSVVAREKDRYGGIKWGSAFFGWLTATGTAVILTALLLAAGTAVGVVTDTNATDAQNQAAGQAGTLGVVGGIVLLAVLLIAYYCGGYVAGRMARFSGVKQGVAVWIWGIVIAILVGVAGALLGDKYDVLSKLGGFPRLPFNGNDITTGGIVAIVIAVVAMLVGAILGGLAGMRYHRNVDKAGLGQ